MPRRNRRRRSRPGWQPEPTPEPEPNYEEIARRLVKAGTCSRFILDHPLRATTTSTKGTPQ